MLITFEGPEGSGKTTQIGLLHEALQNSGHACLKLREPGSTPIGLELRSILLERGLHVAPITEALIFCAARYEMVQTLVLPAIAAGTIVLCDRYTDSTLVIQGYGRDADLATLRTLTTISSIGLVPDMTIMLDVMPHVGYGRKKQQNDLNDFDARTLLVGDNYRAGYRDLMSIDPARWRYIAPDTPIEETADRIWQWVIGHPKLQMAPATR